MAPQDWRIVGVCASAAAALGSTGGVVARRNTTITPTSSISPLQLSMRALIQSCGGYEDYISRSATDVDLCLWLSQIFN